MRVAILVINFPRFSETFIANKFLGLLDCGLDVRVCCTRSEEAEWQRFPQLTAREGIKSRVYVCWPHRPRWLAALLIPFAVLRCLFRNFTGTIRYLFKGTRRFGILVLKHLYFDADMICLKPDLIHMEFGPQAVGRLHLRDFLKCRLVVSFRGYDLNYVGLENPTYYAGVFEQADGLHLLGQDLWRRAQRRGCSPEKNHVLIPPAIDTQFFDAANRLHVEKAGTRERPLRILSVGRLEWKKGYVFAMQAVEILKKKGIHCEYRIIGDGDYFEAVSFFRHLTGLDQEVQLIGAQPQSVVKEEMLWADVFLHSAVSEGFCNAVIEAQSMRLPVVCSDADGLAENVENGKTGCVVARRDPEALAACIETLAQDPAMRQTMGDQGRIRVQSRFRKEEQILQFDHFYRSLLNQQEKQ